MFQFGHAGVDFFFVISGFIILFVHYGDIDAPARLGHYAGRRFTRVMPTYWIAMAVSLAIVIAGGHAVPPLTSLAFNAALLSSSQEMFVGVAWTLQFEIVFYAIFAILILHRMTGLVFLAVWLSATVLGFVIPMGATGLPYPFHGAYNIEFFLGMVAAAVLTNHTVRRPLVWLATGVLLLGTSAVLEDFQYFDGYGAFARFIYGIPSAMVVLGIAEADRQSLLRIPSLWRTLGSASYSIYLFQFVFIGLVWQGMLALGLDPRLPVAVQFILLTLLAVIGGIGMSRWVEYPLMKFVRDHPVRGLVPTGKG